MSTIPDLTQAADVADDDLLLLRNTTTGDDQKLPASVLYERLGMRTRIYTAGGTANALTVTLDPALTAWAEGVYFRVRPSVANTGAATISPNGVTAADLKLMDGATDVPAEFLQPTNIYGVYYDGTNAVIVDAPSVIQTASNSDGYATRYANGDQVAWGRATITPSAADTFTSKFVDYALEFTGTTGVGEVDKSVQVSAVSTVAGTTLYGWGSSSVTLSNSQLVLRIIRTNTTDSVVDWIVRGRWFL